MELRTTPKTGANMSHCLRSMQKLLIGIVTSIAASLPATAQPSELARQDYQSEPPEQKDARTAPNLKTKKVFPISSFEVRTIRVSPADVDNAVRKCISNASPDGQLSMKNLSPAEMFVLQAICK